LPLVVDLIGTFVFAVEGATAAIEGDLDLLGLMVLAFATALAGMRWGLPPTSMTITGAIACFVLRVAAVYRHWNLPRVLHEAKTSCKCVKACSS
jgi:uncharacterized membrane protein YeiH